MGTIKNMIQKSKQKRDEKDIYLKQIEELQSKIEKLEREKDSNTELYEERIARLQEAYESKKTEVQEQKKEKNSLKDTIKKLKKKIRDIIDSSKKREMEIRKEYQRKIDDLEHRNEDLTAQLTENEGKIEYLQKENTSLKSRLSRALNINAITEEQIKDELKNKYPTQIAIDYNIDISRVYDVVEGLSNKEKNEILTYKLVNNPLYADIRKDTYEKKLAGKDNPAESALFDKYKTLKEDEIIYLLKICYDIKQYKDNDNIINVLYKKLMMKQCKDPELNKALIKEKRLMTREEEVREIRKIYKKSGFSKELKEHCKAVEVSQNMLNSIVGSKVKTIQEQVK